MIRLQFILFIFLALTICLHGQNNRFIEEIALQHLTREIKSKKFLENFKFYTNGEVTNDTSYLSLIKEYAINSEKNTIIFKNPFKNCKILEDKNLVKFSIPNKLNRDVSGSYLSIYHFIKEKNKYIVGFTIGNFFEGTHQTVVLLMNLQGDLVDIRYVGAK